MLKLGHSGSSWLTALLNMIPTVHIYQELDKLTGYPWLCPGINQTIQAAIRFGDPGSPPLDLTYGCVGDPLYGRLQCYRLGWPLRAPYPG